MVKTTDDNDDFRLHILTEHFKKPHMNVQWYVKKKQIIVIFTG